VIAGALGFLLVGIILAFTYGRKSNLKAYYEEERAKAATNFLGHDHHLEDHHCHDNHVHQHHQYDVSHHHQQQQVHQEAVKPAGLRKPPSQRISLRSSASKLKAETRAAKAMNGKVVSGHLQAARPLPPPSAPALETLIKEAVERTLQTEMREQARALSEMHSTLRAEVEAASNLVTAEMQSRPESINRSGTAHAIATRGTV